MADKINWDLLLRRIKAGNCTPFLGAGACVGVLPSGRTLAQNWGQQHRYPLDDSGDLVRVSQYIAVKEDPMWPKEEIAREFKKSGAPDFSNVLEPHGLLADLPLPVYMTTNYDDFMVRALCYRKRAPVQSLCRWNKFLRDNVQSPFDKRSFEPTSANPVVFHLHGHCGVPESLVLTEDDYLDFLVNISSDPDLLPARIQKALSGASLMFLGYAIMDWDFRVLFRSLVSYLERSLSRLHVSVQLAPGSPDMAPERKERAQEYLNKYFGKLQIQVYWGTCEQFTAELRKRWDAIKDAD
jgi:hypothetical protein